MTSDRVRDAFAGQNAELIFANLSNEQGDAIREVFAAADSPTRQAVAATEWGRGGSGLWRRRRARS